MLLNSITQPVHWERVPNLIGFQIGSSGFYSENADLPRSLQRSRNHHAFFRHEVQAGDVNPDATIHGNRSEIRTFDKIRFLTPNWFAFAHCVANAAQPATGYDLVVWQCHNSADAGDTFVAGPPIEAHLEGGTGDFVIVRRYDARASTTSDVTTVECFRLPAAQYARGAWHGFVVNSSFDPTGTTGVLQVWMDGALIVNLTGIALGFNDTLGPYWKLGNYFYGSGGPFLIYTANIEWGYGSLYGRVGAPLPLPDISG